MEAVVETIRHTWQRAMPALVVASFYFGVLVYPLMRMLTLAFPAWEPNTAELLAIMVGPAAGRMAYEFVPSTFTRWLSALSQTTTRLKPMKQMPSQVRDSADSQRVRMLGTNS